MKEDIYIIVRGRIWREKNTLIFTGKNTKYVIPINRISSIHLFGNSIITSQILKLLSKKKIPVFFYTEFGQFIGRFIPNFLPDGKLRIRQYEIFLNNRIKYGISILKSIQNSMLYQIKSKYSTIHYNLIKNIDVDRSNSIEMIRGLEANLWKIFYDYIRSFTSNLSFDTRSFRPPKDEGNAIISFLNSILYSIVESDIRGNGLDVSLGFVHEPQKRISLALDIADIFKPVIVTPILFYFERNYKKEFFEKVENDRVYLSKEGRVKALELLRKKLENNVFYSRLNKEITIRSVIRFEIKRLKKSIENGYKFKEFSPW